jgi:predicted PurR-regulated permease PerM
MTSQPGESPGPVGQESTSVDPTPEPSHTGPARVDAPSVGPVQPVVEPVVVPRWVQAIVVAVALFALAGLAQAAAPVLLLFLVAAVISLIINPLVALLQRGRIPRGIAIGVVFALFFGVLAGSVALLVRPVTSQVEALEADLPRLIRSANTSLSRLQEQLDDRGIDIQIQRPGETALETLRASVLRGSGDVVSFTRDLVTLVAEAGFMLVLILVIAVYMLLYGERIGALTRRVMPPGDGTIEDDFPAGVQSAVFGYVRGQLAFSFIMGLSAGVALWVFGALGIFPAGQSYAVFFGVFYGLMELIPYLGPVLGALPPIMVALFQGEPLTALWLVLLFVALQQIEGHVVAPLVFGHSLRINPLLVIFALLLGGHLQGIIGALLALPLAAIARQTLLYLRRHLVMEPWGTPSAATLRGQPVPQPASTTTSTDWGDTWSVRLARGLRERWRRRRSGRNPEDGQHGQDPREGRDGQSGPDTGTAPEPAPAAASPPRTE